MAKKINRQKIVFGLTLFCCSIGILSGQDNGDRPQPMMINEFRTAGSNCEDGFARMDNFFIQLNNDPNARGMIIRYGDLKDPRAARRRALQLSNYLTSRKYDSSRVTFVRAGRKDGRRRRSGSI